MKYFIWFLRITVGLLFIFSGLVKANDPLGLTYKMDEFFEIWQMYSMHSYTLLLSVLMIAFEIISGVAIIVGNGFRVFSTLLLLLNIFYTFLTGYALFSGKVKECGCFGDCIKISNTATFYKDVALSIATLILFLYRYRVFPVFKTYINTSITILVIFFSFGIQWWALEHLPFYDCLAYKAGNNLWDKMQAAPDATPPVIESIFIYEKNGKKQEFTMENYPWQDSTWKYVDRKDKLIKEGTGQPQIPHDFAFVDSTGNDKTQDILTAKGYTFVLFVRQDPNTDNMDKIRELATKATALHIPFYVAWSGDRESLEPFRQKWNLNDLPFDAMDGTISKTALRSNPGLMLLKDGVVQHKWSYRDYPADASLNDGKLDLK